MESSADCAADRYGSRNLSGARSRCSGYSCEIRPQGAGKACRSICGCALKPSLADSPLTNKKATPNRTSTGMGNAQSRRRAVPKAAKAPPRLNSERSVTSHGLLARCKRKGRTIGLTSALIGALRIFTGSKHSWGARSRCCSTNSSAAEVAPRRCSTSYWALDLGCSAGSKNFVAQRGR